MKQDKVQLPSGMGGLVRYFDEYKAKIELRPEYIVVAIILLIIVEFYLHSL